MDKVGIKQIVVLGGFLSTIGFVVAAFGPNIYFTIVGYGVLAGKVGRFTFLFK